MRTLALIATALVATASSPTVVAKVKLKQFAQPCAAAGGAGAVWVSEFSAPYLLKINPKTNKVVKKIGIGSGACGLAYGAGSLWIEDTNSNTISRVSVAASRRIKAVPVGNQPYDATFAFGSAWATSYGDGDLERIDPAKNAVVKKWKLGAAIGVVGAFGSIWATGLDGVIRVDPATNAVLATIPIPAGGGWTAASTDAVWVTTGESKLARIDPQTNAVTASVQLRGNLGDPAFVGGKVWVPEVQQNDVAIVDPATATLERRLKVGVGPFVVTEIKGEAWIPSYKGYDIWRVRP
jgi:DNA-binding beta-propeller fold protein YncE